MKRIAFICSCSCTFLLLPQTLLQMTTLRLSLSLELESPLIYLKASRRLLFYSVADIERYQESDLFGLMSRVPSISFVRNGGRGSSNLNVTAR